MNEAHEDLRAELKRLADRLARIEEHLDLSQDPLPDTKSKRSEAPASAITEPTASPAAPPTTAPGEDSDLLSAEPGRTAPFRPAAAQAASRLIQREPAKDTATSAPPVSVTRRPPLIRRPKRDGASLEMLIGGKWLAWVGAIVIVIAVGWLLQYGYTQGWFGRITPAWRCILIAGFGLLLVGCGEVALRKVGRAAAVGLFGAGIATIYMTTLAASRLVDPPLITDLTLFILLAIAALFGIAITLRGRLLSIGVLSIVGGYLAPVLASSASPIIIAFPLYLTMIFGVTLLLSALMPKPFRALRYVGMGGQGVLGILWLNDLGRSNGVLALIFFALWWGMLLVECVRAALKEESTNGNAIATLLATSWFVTVGCIALQWLTSVGNDWLGAFTLGVGGLAVAVAGQFGPGLNALRRAPRNALERLAVSLWAQGAILLAVAVALQFSGFGRSVAWLMVALASFEIGRRLPSRGVDVFGLVVLIVALLHFVLHDTFGSPMQAVVMTMTGSWRITEWAILALFTTAVLVASAHRLRPDAKAFWYSLRFILLGAGVLAWFAAWIGMADGLTITAGWLFAAVPFLALAPYGRTLHYREFGLSVVLFTACRWFALDGMSARIDHADRAGNFLPLLNAQTLVGVLIAAVGYWASRPVPAEEGEVSASDDGSSPARPASVAASWLPLQQITILLVSFFVLLVMSFEVDRAIIRAATAGSLAWSDWHLRILCWSALWAGGALGLLVFGQRQRWTLLVNAGWVTLFLCGVCWLFMGTLFPRLLDEPHSDRLVLNFQFIIGVALAGGITWAISQNRKYAESKSEDAVDGAGMSDQIPGIIGWALIGLIGLWLGSLEIDRYFNAHMAEITNAKMASQAGLSIYWMIYGIGLVIVGFARRIEWFRYCGLGLIGVVLVKVVVIDTVELSGLYRPLSAIVVGLLAMGMSIAYLKISPRLLGEDNSEPAEGKADSLPAHVSSDVD